MFLIYKILVLLNFKNHLENQFSTFFNYGFNDSSIKSLIIPSHFEKIQKGLFMNCKFLEAIEFQGNDVTLQMLKK